MPTNRFKGKKAEDAAHSYLLDQGLTLITKNYRCRFGEIDLIMQDNNYLVFIEVRYRQSDKFGSAIESVDQNKQRKLVFTANHYLQNNPTSLAIRFDVIAISSQQQFNWITNAFLEG